MAVTENESEENFCEFEEGDIYAEGFGLVASLVMRDKSISSMAKALYAYLMTFSNRSGAAWPSTNRILDEMSLSRNSFYKYRSELRDAGFLDWTTFGREGGGRRTVYRIFKIRKTNKEFSTNPRSEQYPKIWAIASENANESVEMWKTDSGKPTNSSNFGTSTYNKQLITNQTTTTAIDNDSHLGQRGTAIAEPVVSSPTAPSSSVDLDVKKNEEAPLVRDSIDAAFYALEARSLRRTKLPEKKEAARLSYRRLVAEGHSIEDISAAYDCYLVWARSPDVEQPWGLERWLREKNGFGKNNDLAKEKRAQAANLSAEGGIDAAEYRKRSQEVSTIGFDAEAVYRVEFAEQSDDEHLRHLAASVRADEPVTVGNGLVDDRLSKRPSYDVLWSQTNKKEHRRDYVLWAYERLKTEGKVR